MEESKKPILQELYDLCYAAHRNVSFSPEKRAAYYVKEYSEMLESDLKELGENQGNYKAKFIEKFSAWMSAKGNCISSMITGGSNFPVRRAEKANNRERAKSDDFFKWREKYFKAVNRVPTKSPEDELEIAEAKLENLRNNQEEYKQINAAIRKSKITEQNELINHLVNNYDFDPHKLSLIDLRGGKFKIPSYVLTNNNAVIKNTTEKVQIMQARIDRKNTWEDIHFEGGYITIEDDRVKIYHDEKPSREVINEIKKSGYRWSPHWKCWCRKHTGNAIYGIKFLSFINNGNNN